MEQKECIIYQLKERCGVLIKSNKNGFLWVITPFIDDTLPIKINMPEKNIDAIVVLNNINEGCLPLTSFYAIDSRLPKDRVYVLNTDNLHDWHPKYPFPNEVNKLIQAKQIPKSIDIGYLKIHYNTGDDFIKVNLTNPDTVEYYELYIGINLYYKYQEGITKSKQDKLHFIGNFDDSKFKYTLENIMKTVCEIGHKNISIIMCPEWIKSNDKSLISSFNLLGFDVYTLGKFK